MTKHLIVLFASLCFLIPSLANCADHVYISGILNKELNLSLEKLDPNKKYKISCLVVPQVASEIKQSINIEKPHDHSALTVHHMFHSFADNLTFNKLLKFKIRYVLRSDGFLILRNNVNTSLNVNCVAKEAVFK